MGTKRSGALTATSRTGAAHPVREVRRRAGRPRLTRLTAPLLTLPLLLVPGPAQRADAFRFYGVEARIYIPTPNEAWRWSTREWGAGDTLIWRIADIPEWSHWFGSSEGAARAVEKALSAWSNIQTADISWRVEGVAEIDEARDDTPFVTIDPDSGTGGYADLWGRNGQLTHCVVRLGSWAAEEPPDSWNELEEDDPQRLYPALGTLIHEFGHCLGLAHSVELPGQILLTVRHSFDEERDRYLHAWASSSEVPPRDPQMSYGRSDYGIAVPVTHDDIVGASLLRPADGWRRETGSIAGRVLLDGEPLPYAHVWAFGPGSARGLPNAVGSFSNRNGDLVIEGLDPGVYSLWVSPMGSRSAHFDLVGRGSLIDLADTLRPFPVVVAAGQTTEGVEIHAYRGRDCEPPAPCGR